MTIKHKYYYVENGFYIITEDKRINSIETTQPWDLYKDQINLVIGYIRWSDASQTSGHSYSIQESAVIARAKKLGFDGVIIFVEAAKSAYHYRASKRKKIKEMKEFIIENPNANTLIFYDESRLTRYISDFYFDIVIDLRAKKPNIKFYSTEQENEWNENDPSVQMRLVMVHNESANKSQKVSDSQKVFIKDNKRPPANNPYGYSRISCDSTELIQDKKSGIVVLIFYLYSFGYSDKNIAELLEGSNIPSPSGYQKWSDSSVRYILNNEWYLGNLTWDVRVSFSDSKKKPAEDITLIANHHPALIENGLWEITQNIRKLKSKRNRMDSEFILKDLVSCSDCGDLLKTKNQTSAKSKTDGSIYYCPSCKCKVKKDAMNQTVIKDFSVRWGREMKYYPERIEKEMKRWDKVCNQHVKVLNAEIKAVREKRALLNPAYQNNDKLLEVIEGKLKALEHEKLLYANSCEKIKTLIKEDITKESLNRFSQDFQSYSNVEKRSLLLQAIKEIKYDFKNNTFLIEYRITPYAEIEDYLTLSETVV